MPETVAFRNISKSYAGRAVFKDVNLTLSPNEPVVVMGENGCGKSTLLKIAAGVLAPSEGEVCRRPGIKISYVSERFPKLAFTVEEYLTHMGGIQGVSPQGVRGFMAEYFEYLHFPPGFKKNKIYNCSKGTIQKVNALQALITRPDLLLLDEPFSGMDEESVENYISLLKQLAVSGVSLLLTCHEKLRAQKISETVYIFNNQRLLMAQESPAHFCVKFYACEPEFTLDGWARRPSSAALTHKAGPLYELSAEKTDLKDALAFLFERGCEIHSVNPGQAVSHPSAGN